MSNLVVFVRIGDIFQTLNIQGLSLYGILRSFCAFFALQFMGHSALSAFSCNSLRLSGAFCAALAAAWRLSSLYIWWIVPHARTL